MTKEQIGDERAYEQYEGLVPVRLDASNAEQYVESMVDIFYDNFSEECSHIPRPDMQAYFLSILNLETGESHGILDESSGRIVSFVLGCEATESTEVTDGDVLDSMVDRAGGDPSKVFYVNLAASDATFNATKKVRLAQDLFEHELLPEIEGNYNAIATRYDDTKPFLGRFYAKHGFDEWEPQPGDNPKIFEPGDPAGRQKKHYMLRMLHEPENQSIENRVDHTALRVNESLHRGPHTTPPIPDGPVM